MMEVSSEKKTKDDMVSDRDGRELDDDQNGLVKMDKRM